MSKRRIPKWCPRTCSVFDTDMDALLQEVSKSMNTDILDFDTDAIAQLLQELDANTDALLDALDTSGSCPHCGSDGIQSLQSKKTTS
jgi:hypothetical protein